jgi:hypothetical protein
MPSILLFFGYKISDNNYHGANYFITILGFSIYKSYYLSEQKTTNVNVYTIFIYEFNGCKEYKWLIVLLRKTNIYSAISCREKVTFGHEDDYGFFLTT